MALVERVRGNTIASSLASRATADPQGEFLIFGEERLTFGQVEDQAESLAASLGELGIGKGDRVAVALPTSPEFVVAIFAAAKLGAIIVPLNPRLTTPELHYMLRHSEAVAAICVETYNGVDYLQIFDELLVQLPALRHLVTVGEEELWHSDRILQFEDLLSAGGGRDYSAPSLDAHEDPFALLYTSGTTGKPKGVELTHSNLLEVAAATSDVVGLTPEDRIIGVTALFHVFGLGPGILGSLVSGASLVLQDEFGGAPTLDLIEEHGVTVHYGVPTLFMTELREQEVSPRDLSSLRVGVVAGAPVSDDLLRRIERDLCPCILVAYSLTETSSTVCMTGPSDPPERRFHTVGRPVHGTEIKVVEQDGTQLPVESVGEIAVKGPGVMKGYYRQPQETASQTDEDGFFRTGDLGMIDEEGCFHLVGRRKEVIIRGGFGVHPREVEDRLHSHPAVHEAAVVGIPDDVLGEAICALIVPVEGAIVTGQEVKDWCGVTLADYKIPDSVRFLDEFPRTGTGKIRRIELARMLSAELLGRRD